MCGEPRRLLLRPDERAGRRPAASARTATGSGPPSPASTSSSSSRWIRRTGPRPDIARPWVKQLVAGDPQGRPRHLVTVGLVDWSLDRPGLTSGFVPEKIAGDLDFICVHLYPEKGKLDEALETLKGFDSRQAGGDRGDVPAEVFPEGTGSSSSIGREARAGLDRLLLGQAARGTAQVEDDRRRDPARLARAIREASEVKKPGSSRATTTRRAGPRQQPESGRI